MIEPCVLGIDPGKKGALVAVGDFGVVAQLRMPLTLGSKGDIDWRAVWAFMSALALRGIVLEVASIRPREGGYGGLQIGSNWGTLRGLAIATGAPLEECRPNRWRKEMNLPARPAAEKDKRKQDSIAKALGLFPALNLTHNPLTNRTTKPHDGLAEAACMAEVGRRLWLARGAA